jgi:CBS domain-containing protein
MKIREIMTRNVKVASADDDLQHAARLMEESNFGALPVGEGGRLVGILSDRDIAIRVVARGLPLDHVKVRDVMSTDVKFVYEDESIEDVAGHMSDVQVRRMPVLSRENRLVGIVSLGDLAINRPQPAGDALSWISQPTFH